MEIKEFPCGKIAVYNFNASGQPRAVILFLHGMGEHIGRYKEWFNRFNEADISVRAFDLPGHGYSGGKRGATGPFRRVYDTIDMLIKEIAADLPEVPLFLYGHSLGGGIVLNYVLQRKPSIRGAIATSPWIRLSFDPPKSSMLLAKVGSKVWPEMIQPAPLILEHLSHDPEEVEAYRTDPLIHARIAIGVFTSITEAGKDTCLHASSITLPLLLIHGRDDMITSPAATMEVAAAAPKVTLKIWDGGYHELHNDLVRDEHFEFIVEWIDNML